MSAHSTALTAIEARATDTLVDEITLGYDLGDVNEMLVAFNGADPDVVIDGATWNLVSALAGSEAQVVGMGDDRLEINLGGGAGFRIALVRNRRPSQCGCC